MKLAQSLLDLVLILLSFGAVGSQLDPSMRKFDGDEYHRYVSAAFFFVGFVYLHWSLWRVLVPRGITEHRCSRFIEWGRRRTGFFRGAIGYGYLMVVAYYLTHFRTAEATGDRFPQSLFWIGLTLVLVGTAARSREVMLHLASGQAGEAASHDSPAKSLNEADASTIRTDA